MLFAVGQGDERFHQRAQRNRLVGITIPPGGEQGPSLDIQEEEKRLPTVGKLSLQNLGCRLREQRISGGAFCGERGGKRSAQQPASGTRPQPPTIVPIFFIATIGM